MMLASVTRRSPPEQSRPSLNNDSPDRPCRTGAVSRVQIAVARKVALPLMSEGTVCLADRTREHLRIPARSGRRARPHYLQIWWHVGIDTRAIAEFEGIQLGRTFFRGEILLGDLRMALMGSTRSIDQRSPNPMVENTVRSRVESICNRVPRRTALRWGRGKQIAEARRRSSMSFS